MVFLAQGSGVSVFLWKKDKEWRYFAPGARSLAESVELDREGGTRKAEVGVAGKETPRKRWPYDK